MTYITCVLTILTLQIVVQVSVVSDYQILNAYGTLIPAKSTPLTSRLRSALFDVLLHVDDYLKNTGNLRCEISLLDVSK